MDEFFPALLELIQCKISGTDVPDIPPVPDQRSCTDQKSCTARPADNDSSAQTAARRTELNLLPHITEADAVITNVGQSPSATKWYYFSSVASVVGPKSPVLCSPLERSVPDGHGSLEHAIVTVNGFTEH